MLRKITLDGVICREGDLQDTNRMLYVFVMTELELGKCLLERLDEF